MHARANLGLPHASGHVGHGNDLVSWRAWCRHRHWHHDGTHSLSALARTLKSCPHVPCAGASHQAHLFGSTLLSSI